MNPKSLPQNWSELLAPDQLLFVRPTSVRRLMLFAVGVLREDLGLVSQLPESFRQFRVGQPYFGLICESLDRIERAIEDDRVERQRMHMVHLSELLKEIVVTAQHFELACYLRDMELPNRINSIASPLDFAHLLCRGSLPLLNPTEADFDDASRNEPTIQEFRIRRNELARKLFAEVFESDYKPVKFGPQWKTSDVVGVARGIYEERAFERMPILADALMDAGCENEEIIGHCRGACPHVRGCWVVDMVLGKG